MDAHFVYNDGMDLGVAAFEWDKGNRDKCQKHGVSLAAVESLFRGPVTVFPDPEHSEAEERFKAIGRTDDGRGVLIVFHPAQAGRGHLHPPGQRPLHAREGG